MRLAVHYNHFFVFVLCIHNILLFLYIGIIAFTALYICLLVLECNIIRAVYDFDSTKMDERESEEQKTIWELVKVENRPYPKVLRFKKDDYMMTTAPENIG